MGGRSPGDRVFVGVYPTGLVYADRARERHGDLVRLGFLSFATLELVLEADCPRELRASIEEHARGLQERAGQQYQVSTSGQTVTLGSGRRREGDGA